MRTIFLMALCLIATLAAGGENPPSRLGRKQGVLDAAAAVRSGDLRFIELTGGYVPDYPMLDDGGSVQMRELWHHALVDCGYWPKYRLVDFNCVGPDAGKNNFPCDAFYDVGYIAAYNTVVYNHFKRNPEALLPYAEKNRDGKARPDFPRPDDGVLDLPTDGADFLAALQASSDDYGRAKTAPSTVTAPPPDGEYVWIVDGEAGTPIFRVSVPADWTVEGNGGFQDVGGTPRYSIWLRLGDPAAGWTYELVVPVGRFRWIVDHLAPRQDRDKNNGMYLAADRIFAVMPRDPHELLEKYVVPLIQSRRREAEIVSSGEDKEAGDNLREMMAVSTPFPNLLGFGGGVTLTDADGTIFLSTAITAWPDPVRRFTDVTILDWAWGYVAIYSGPSESVPTTDALRKGLLERIRINPAWLAEGEKAWRREVGGDGPIQCDRAAFYSHARSKGAPIVRAAIPPAPPGEEGGKGYADPEPESRPETVEARPGFADAVFSTLVLADTRHLYGTIQ